MKKLLFMALSSTFVLTTHANSGVQVFCSASNTYSAQAPVGPSQTQCSESDANLSYGRYASGYAQEGILRVSTASNAAILIGGQTSFAVDAQVSFGDTITIRSGNLTGFGMATVALPISYTVSAFSSSDTSRASLRVVATANTFYGIDSTVTETYSSSTGHPVVTGGLPSSFSFGFTWGTPFQISFMMLANVNGLASEVGSQASALVDASRSLYWGGITSIVSGGSSVSSFSISSVSGADYNRSFAPVPEVSTSFLLLSGIATLVAAMKFTVGERRS